MNELLAKPSFFENLNTPDLPRKSSAVIDHYKHLGTQISIPTKKMQASTDLGTKNSPKKKPTKQNAILTPILD
jgi:hypothetical protein